MSYWEKLPDEVGSIVDAIENLRNLYSDTGLQFTPDGKFVGDLGEAIAAKKFGLELKQGALVDGYCQETGRAVQIKATGRKSGAFYFRATEFKMADPIYLVAINIDWINGQFQIVYNGPELAVRQRLGQFSGQKGISITAISKLNELVAQAERIPSIS